MSEAAFAKTLRLMRGMLAEAEMGLGLLEGLAIKYGVMEGIEEVTMEQAMELGKEVRVVMKTLGFEPTAVLVQAMLLAGDPMLATVMGLELERPASNVPN
jgi:hypothetical protein